MGLGVPVQQRRQGDRADDRRTDDGAPDNETVHVYLRSYDVLHGFYVPEFNFSRYASPGYWTSFDLNVLHNGVYRGQCTQLCGLYHSLMFFNVRSVSPSDYRTWLRGDGGVPAVPPELGRAAAQRREGQHQRDGTGLLWRLGNSGTGNSGSTGNTGGAYYGD